MRLILFILFTITLFSCNPRGITSMSFNNTLSYNIAHNESGASLDTFYFREIDIDENIDIFNHEIATRSNSIIVDENQVEENVATPIKKNKINKEEIQELLPEFDIEYRSEKKEGYGLIAYNVPNELELGNFYTIKLRISSEIDKVKIVRGERGIEITARSEDEKVILEHIQVDSLMEAKLSSDVEKLQIELLSENEQCILDRGYTEWVWRIKPLKSGPIFMMLSVNISGKDIVVYEKTIEVKGKPVRSTFQWLIDNWEAFFTLIVIPILIPIFKKIKKNKKEED